jgi:anti-sigma B factor antagonist
MSDGDEFFADIVTTDRRTVVRLVGELDLTTVPEVDAVVSKALSGATGTVAIDLAGVSFCDSTGLRFLILVNEESRRRNVPLLICHAQPAVRKVMRLTGADDVLPLDPTDEPHA